MADKNERRGGILGDFSLSQIVATGLAAATSFALSAQIGIAGLDHRRGHRSGGVERGDAGLPQPTSTPPPRSSARSAPTRRRTDGPGPGEAPPTAGATRVMPAPAPAPAEGTRVAASGTPIAPPEVIDAARERQRTRLRRRVAVIATVAAIAVVLAYALVVSLATQGAGIGPSFSPAAPAAEHGRTATDERRAAGSRAADRGDRRGRRARPSRAASLRTPPPRATPARATRASGTQGGAGTSDEGGTQPGTGVGRRCRAPGPTPVRGRGLRLRHAGRHRLRQPAATRARAPPGPAASTERRRLHGGRGPGRPAVGARHAALRARCGNRPRGSFVASGRCPKEGLWQARTQRILRFFSPPFLNRGLWQPPRCHNPASPQRAPAPRCHNPRFHNASLARAAGLV